MHLFVVMPLRKCNVKCKMAAAAYRTCVSRSDPIRFVRASEEYVASEPRSNTIRDTGDDLSGEEARAFYERVVTSMVKKDSRKMGRKPDSRDQAGAKDLKTHKVKRKGSTPDVKGAPSPSPSPSQLFLFAQEGMLKELRQVLDASTSPDVDLNVRDMYGWSLLMSSAYAGHHDIVCYLLSKGVQWKGVCDKQGRTAVDLALMAGHRHVADVIQSFSLDDSNEVERSRENELAMPGGCAVETPTSQTQQQVPFFCSLCNMAVRESTETTHSHSTLHQFNCHHHPSVHQYGIPMSNKGYKLLVKGGWNPEHGLGECSEGKQFPVKTVLKRDRLGLGADAGKQARVTHFGPNDTDAVRQPCAKRPAAEDKRKDKCLPKRQRREEQSMKDRQWDIDLRRYMNADN